jgi:phosphatidylserine/phosphatidylglycerophosphate/cardiolipin synthase-like enzyme/subtilisin family serine protease
MATYTYRNGNRIELSKDDDRFVVRAEPEDLADAGFSGSEQVSPSSSRVTVAPEALEEAMSRARDIAPTHHSYRQVENDQEFLITDRIFVRFTHDMTDVEIGEFGGKYGLVVLDKYSGRDYLFRLTDSTNINPVKLVVKLTEEEKDLVELAEHDLNYQVETYQFAPPSDSSYEAQWHLHRLSADPAFDPRSSTSCDQAWKLLGGYGSPDVVIGVTDDGCRLDHKDFDSQDKFVGWGYWVKDRLVLKHDIDAVPAGMYEPGANHGTSCAGVIAAETDQALTVGAAPDCRLFPIKWQLASNGGLMIGDSRLMKTLEVLSDKVDIISSSWGRPVSTNYSQQVLDMISRLARVGGRRGKGILFLWAAGNENTPLHHTSDQEIPYSSGWYRDALGNQTWTGVEKARSFSNNLVGIDGLLHIAALSSTAQRSHYSNYGTGIALCAPSSNSHRYGRMTVPGLRITTTAGSTISTITHGFGGTSSATPLVAGIAALVISANPDLSAREVAGILQRTASKDLNLDPYPKTPAAAFDPDPTWDISPVAPFDSGDFEIDDRFGKWSPWFGYGRVDARAAVAEAIRMRPVDPETMSVLNSDISFGTSGCQGETYTKMTSIPPFTVRSKMIAFASPDSTFAVTKRLIDSARHSIIIGIYDFTAGYMKELILKAMQRGVRVQLMLDLDKASGETELFNELVSKGCEAVPAPSCNGGSNKYFPNAHEKIVVIDNKWVLVQSGNYSANSIPQNEGDGVIVGHYYPGNRDMGLAVRSAPMARFFRRLIESDMALEIGSDDTMSTLDDSGELGSPGLEFSILAPHEVPDTLFPSMEYDLHDGLSIQPVLTPDNYMKLVPEILEQAATSIYIEQQYIRANQPQVSILLAAIGRAMTNNPALEIRIILAPPFGSGSDKTLERNIRDLDEKLGLSLGDQIRLLNNNIFQHCHNKLIIVDGQTVLVGSQNWSDTAINENREASLLLTYQPVAEYFTSIFNYDWENGFTSLDDTNPMSIMSTEALSTGRATPLSVGDYAEV